jgi:polyhydroxyalkanoate synthesis regulator phasin
MCFFFVGSATSQMQKEIQELRKQVADLQSKQVSSHDAA